MVKGHPTNTRKERFLYLPALFCTFDPFSNVKNVTKYIIPDENDRNIKIYTFFRFAKKLESDRI